MSDAASRSTPRPRPPSASSFTSSIGRQGTAFTASSSIRRPASRFRRKDQVKGYETEAGGYIRFEADEIAKAVPDSDKTLAVEAFIDCGEVDELHFDRPYYLAPAAPGDVATFDALRNAMRAAGVAAVARAVLFRRVRSVLVRAHGKGLIATTLKFDYEVRSPDEAFRDLPEAEVDKEMLDLALHIIKTKRGRFDPSTFDDRYEAAVQALVAAKLEGRELVPQKPPAPTPEGDLLAALRRSAGRPRPGRAKTGSGKAARRRAA